MKKLIIATLTLIGAMQLSAQEEVLMTINGEPVTKAEFEYIYNKNNSDNAIDKKTLDEYVDLFVNFKLKVAEAKAQGLDTTPAFKRELNGYRKQLAKPYLTDAKLEDALYQEAYSH
ncbi:MAG: peptidylprolyl isomerase, partial [Paludibacteraceae bacterium]|nr:peptidylprolyl isomerase [Paludibacteraceae bacterium]